MADRFTDEAGAKRFFIERIVSQAGKDGVALSDLEKEMMAWSEAEMTPASAIELHSRFEAEISDEVFEQKITALIKKAYAEDVRRDPSFKERYRQALRALNRGDHYISIMIQPALGFRAQLEATLRLLLHPLIQAFSGRHGN